jgi:hypothetical protein
MRSTIIMIVLLFGSSPGLWAQEQWSTTIQTQDLAWDRVGRIRANQKIDVQLQTGQKLKGEFVEANASGILLRIKSDKSMNISREEILRISRRSGGRAALIGLGIGAGVGAAIGASGVAFAGSSDTGMNRSEGAAIFMLPLGLAGAAVGGLTGINVTIYKSPTAKFEKRK